MPRGIVAHFFSAVKKILGRDRHLPTVLTFYAKAMFLPEFGARHSPFHLAFSANLYYGTIQSKKFRK